MHKTHYRLLVCLMAFIFLIILPTSFAADVDADLMDGNLIYDDSLCLADSVENDGLLDFEDSADDNSLDSLDPEDDLIESSESNSDVLSEDYYFDSNAEKDGNGTEENPYKNLDKSRIRNNSVIHLASGAYNLQLPGEYTNITLIGQSYDQTRITFSSGTLSLNGNVVFNSISLIGQSAAKTKINFSSGLFTLINNVCFQDISLIGQGASQTTIKGNNRDLYAYGDIILQNLTLDSVTITNKGKLNAADVIFSHGDGTYTSSKWYGGAIYSYDSQYSLSLRNCSFYNNSASIGGAIYLSGSNAEIIDCEFIDNNATQFYGGAICSVSDLNSMSTLTIKNTKFMDDSSNNNTGGALYLVAVNFNGNNISVYNCSSTLGGAFTFLNVNAKISRLYGIDNTARYDGGVIYQTYGNLTLSNSTFISNNARNGAGLFAYGLNTLSICNNSFINNSASESAGAIYSVFNNNSNISNSYENNTASSIDFKDVYDSSFLSLIIQDNNYTIYNYNPSANSLPSNYSSLSEGYVTSVKDQGNGGNCWAFATIATLESCILKASGDNLDLSEENMKNVAELYSIYGWNMETNEGGYDDTALGYLLSWLGPVSDEDGIYDPKGLLSPVLSGVMHVQNVMYLKRDSFTDNDMIKRAIMDYGAAFTPIYLRSYLVKKDSSIGYYKEFTNDTSPNHAVVLIGWDDNIEVPGAPGKGAWIAKNSWGNSGNKGIFYLSYYDVSSPPIGVDDATFTFILNDTVKFDKNYQYDIAKTDYFYNNTTTVWYKNIFNATDNEYLTAVSTYFEKETTWNLSIYVNNSKKLVQSGVSKSGYWTIYLREPISLNVGDIFEIEFKIKVSANVGVPVSEIVSLNNKFYKENVSFISYNGKNWTDLYDLVWNGYPNHNYSSQVACIKAFTVLDKIDTALTLDLGYISNIEGNNFNPVNITVNVLNQYGYPVNCGQVKFNFSNEDSSYEIKYVDVYNGVAKISHIFKKGFNTIFAEFEASGYISSSDSSSVNITKYDVNMTAKITNNIYYASVDITLSEKINETISLILGYKNFTAKSVNGKVSINLTGLNLGKNNLRIVLYPALYDCNEITSNFTISTTVSLPKYNNFTYGAKYSVKFLDKKANPLKNTNVTISFGGKTYKLKTDSNGIVNITNYLKPGSYTVKVKNPATLEEKTHKIKVLARIDQNKNLTMYYGAGKYYNVRVLDNYGNIAKNVSVKFTINGNTYYKRTNSKGIASLKISLKPKTYSVSASYKGFTVKNKVTVKSTIITKNLSHKKAKTIKFTAKLVNTKGAILKNKYITFKFKGKKYKRKTNAKGIATLSLKSLKKGKYSIYSTYGKLTIKNTIKIT
ncbi:C1 family peptidase [Methanobrevibacter sp.]|uniref:C1 family peptidase n=1 Tax=Methanobrevibacter sp. TaxID=66852 RepID=UPI0025DDDE41|nr:C1 family peptidase [Methanobrevibacter sp.]MBQ2962738.1 hypothetical protein [Methanobrevibacter sp.]